MLDGQITFDDYLLRKPKFDGSDYEEGRDRDRLNGQIKDIYSLMKDGEWRSLSQISMETGHPEASVSAQLRNLRKKKFGGFTVLKEHVCNGLFKYKLALTTSEGEQK